jgi:hypothetical protein
LNTFEQNAEEGVAIVVNGPGNSEIDVNDNTFSGNAGGNSREFFTSLGAGGGPLLVRLNGNSSSNQVPATQYNYDFSKALATDSLIYEITRPNVGTVGSSDGSVPP